jgi:hypothetical protein
MVPLAVAFLQMPAPEAVALTKAESRLELLALENHWSRVVNVVGQEPTLEQLVPVG